jgi:putative transposase
LSIPLDGRRRLIDEDERISIVQQCNLLGLSRASFYYHAEEISPEELALMKRIDRIWTERPFYGSRRIAVALSRSEAQGDAGVVTNRKRVQRLMKLMGLEAIYAKPRLSQANPEHRKFPYLLRGLTVERPDQVWGTDITYIPLRQGFVFLVAILDWFSRYVVAWDLSTTLDSEFCLRTLDRALQVATPEIVNSDQGVQFTSSNFTSMVLNSGAQMSMDGRGRAFDNIFTERLWRSVKYEEVYIRDYENVPSTRSALSKYFSFYNHERPHQSLEYETPFAVYRRK